MKFKSALVTQASGSVGGATFAHNKGGLYIRARSIPTNPSSAQQQVVRNAMAQLTSRWTDTLTAAQRAAWTVYAELVPILDSLGEARTIPPLAMYVRCNVPRLQAGQAVVDDGPTTYTLGTMSDPTVSVDATADEFDLGYTNTDAWATTTGGFLFASASRPQNATINFFKGPYRFAGLVTGDTTTPPTSPETIALPFACVAGQTIFFQIRASLADGRLTAPFRVSGVGV